MSNDISIKKLLEGVEIEWKKLEEVAELKKGKQLNKELLFENGKYPAYNGGISYSGFTDNYNYKENTIIISQGGASAGFVNFITTKFYANAHCYIVLPDLSVVENKYVYYFLKLNQEKLMYKQHGAGIPALRTNEILELLIPIPPLDIQKKIVKILDNFTELTAELTAELTNRKKQYQFYREKVLTFKDGKVEWKKLGGVIELKKGKQLNKEFLFENGKYPAYNGGISYSGFTNSYNYKENTIIISQGGASAGFVNFITTKFYANAHCYIVLPDLSVVKNKYVYYFLKLNQKKLMHKQHGAGIPALRRNEILDIKIPLPSLKEQQRIVNILDKFDTLTNSISEGLPKEIELRTKQYEYYRDLLLTFPKKDIGI